MRSSPKARRILPLAVIAFLLWPLPAGAQEEPTEAPPDRPGVGDSEPGNPGQIDPVAPGLYLSEVLMFSGGKEVTAAPAGAQTRLRIGLTNSTEQTLAGVSARLGPMKGARAVVGEASYGDLAPGDSASADFVIEVSESECAEFVVVSLTASSGAETFDLGTEFAALCPGPRLQITELDFRGGDGDGVPEPGEVVDLYLTLMNSGRDPATSVKASVKIESEGVGPMTVESAWPDIPPGGSAVNSEAIRVAISEDAPIQQGCEGGPVPEPVEVPPGDPDEPVTTEEDVAEPGGTGAGSAGSEGSETPPQQGQTVISEETVVGSEPGQTGEEPIRGEEPIGEPAADPGVAVEGEAGTTATGYSESLFFSNRIACALMETTEDADQAAAGRVGDGADPASTRNRWLVGGAAILAAAGAGAYLIVRRRRIKGTAV